MHVIGTAGHVDHGKSTLVHALTGIHPDRLKEEKAREMTIELGFAWFTLPDGDEVGIVDVPGHRDFIENMLAGVGGIDAALLVIAADEGVMPQTREHLAILNLLQVRTGLVVITKIDLIDDPEWLDLVEMDIATALQGTTFEAAPVVRVSAHSGSGLDQLIAELAKLLKNTGTRVDFGRARLPIDRIFTIGGFGTVVTGTLLDGTFRVGEEVEILPSHKKSRIRGIQTHKEKCEVAYPGSRTAINLSGIESAQLERGDILTAWAKYKPTKRVDAQVNLVPDSSTGLKHNQEVKLFIGAKETVARVRTIGQDEILPGHTGWIQLETQEAIVAMRSDRFIIRRPSPGETIGGGEIVNPFPGKRYKRNDPAILRQFEAYAGGNPGDILIQAAEDLGITSFDEIYHKARIESGQALELLPLVIEEGRLIPLDGADSNEKSAGLFVSRVWYLKLLNQAIDVLQKFHGQYPLRIGMPREELKSRLKLNQKQFSILVTKWTQENIVQSEKSFLGIYGHSVVFSATQQNKVDQLLNLFAQNKFSPPSSKDCLQIVDQEIFAALQDKGILVSVTQDVVFTKDAFDVMKDFVVKHLNRNGELTAAEFRDAFQTTRKYALAFLEHLDSQSVTERVGDVRKLK